MEAIFQEALDRPVEQRQRFLAEACGDDADLRRRVERLLAHAESTVQFTPLRAELDAAAPHDAGVDELPPGTMIGPYEIAEAVGEGGFGMVYRARQAAPLQRTVALKIVKPGMDTKRVIARFESERQAVAMMDHPNIARVFDAGATEQGRPYFVMEFVDGQPITQFCDDHDLSLQQRIELFIDVCHAVQHAHQKGIMHRDLKPTNILVTMTDGAPTAKVIDFGVAKALRGQLTEQTHDTIQRAPIGTPEYMAPEQATLGAADIDSRVDVYALGVLLYELLAGARPFDALRGSRRSFDEEQQMLHGAEPARPSTRLNRLGDGGQALAIARHRQVSPTGLRRALHGDLDWIIMTCLEKDRDRRYATTQELAADLKRHLRHEPVHASPPSTVYRARKFLRRHRVGVTAAALIALALVVGTITTTWQARRAEQGEQRAVRQTSIANAVNDFLNNDVLAAADPRDNSDRALTVREALDRAAATLDDRFVDEPVVKAAIHATLGEVYLHLGEYESSALHLERADALRRDHLGPDHPDTLEVMNDRARVYRRLQRYDEAERLFRRTIAAARRVVGAEHKLTLQPMNNLAVLYNKRGRYADAEPLYREVLEVRRRMLGDAHPRTLVCMSNLAQHYAARGMTEKAESLMQEALEIQGRTRGPDHYETLVTMNNLATVYEDQGRYAEARAMLKRVVEARWRVLGSEHPYTLLSQVNLGRVYTKLGRYEQAEAELMPAYHAQVETLGRDNRRAIIAMNELARLRFEQGRMNEAHRLSGSAFTTATEALGEDVPLTWHCAVTLGRIETTRGRLEQAEARLQGARDALKRIKGVESSAVLPAMLGLAKVRFRQQRYHAAQELLLSAIHTAEEVLSDDHPQLGRLRAALGQCQLELGRPEDARETLSTALRLFEQTLGADHPRTRACRELLNRAPLE